MYTDMDSILYENGDNGGAKAGRWYSTVEKKEVSWDELCITYGCWAEDAACSAFMAPDAAY